MIIITKFKANLTANQAERLSEDSTRRPTNFLDSHDELASIDRAQTSFVHVAEDDEDDDDSKIYAQKASNRTRRRMCNYSTGTAVTKRHP